MSMSSIALLYQGSDPHSTHEKLRLRQGVWGEWDLGQKPVLLGPFFPERPGRPRSRKEEEEEGGCSLLG